MNINQAYTFVNDAQKEVLGESAIAMEDLTPIVDVGDAIESLNLYEQFYGALVNRIGRMLFVTRPYKGKFAKLFIDSWEFGSIVGKVQAELMDATENSSYEIVNGASYDPYVVNLPVVSAKFYNKGVTFEIDITTPVDQIKQSFKSADEMLRFLSMLEVQVENSLELKLEILASRVVNHFTLAVIENAKTSQVINLLTEYNTIAGTSLTRDQALLDSDFLLYATSRMIEIKSHLSRMRTLYNAGDKARHTPSDRLNFEIIDTFASRLKTHLRSATYHDELVVLDGYEEVDAWQGSGTTDTLTDRLSVNGKITAVDGTEKTQTASNVVAVMFDHEALGILQPQRKVTSAYNPKGEYYNSFHKAVSRYFNDYNENYVVFTLN